MRSLVIAALGLLDSVWRERPYEARLSTWVGVLGVAIVEGER